MGANNSDLIADAHTLAAQGAGYEDILVILKRRITRLDARTAVFGSELARKMELRDAMRARQQRKAS